jgi:hypothetical protein
VPTETSGSYSGGELPHLSEVVTEQAVRTAMRHWRFFAIPAGKGFVQVSLNESQTDARYNETEHL